ncbi:hypothetical protein C493_04116 [Natronolimnohabitans innermongolicus JCM 12255]|uniref:Uncharacterized protein n=1 Tax=Natronolimnohabitans innermongolicus JCM 12255 TaxID=1227499 RepID=L9XFZ0_9EURY|nr:hypothetical protein C493_04116 [Natronolimnohabitans innermongolicus JCM 12255]
MIEYAVADRWRHFESIVLEAAPLEALSALNARSVFRGGPRAPENAGLGSLPYMTASTVVQWPSSQSRTRRRDGSPHRFLRLERRETDRMELSGNREPR